MTATPLKDKIQKILHPEMPTPVTLTPPKVEQEIIPPKSNYYLNFQMLVDNSSFQRAIEEWLVKQFPFFKGIYYRASRDKVDDSFQERSKQVHEAVKLKEEIKSLPPELLKELKERLQLKDFGLTKLE